MSSRDTRFEVIYKEGGASTSIRKIIRDNETGVQYLQIESGYGIALTPLLDNEGKPVTDGRYGY